MLSTDYNLNAENYAQRPLNVGTDSLVFKILKERIKDLNPGGEVLDVGCGTGRSTRFLKELGLRAVGLDISEAMIRQARHADTTSDYHSYQSSESFPFKDSRFSLCLSTWAILELGSKEQLVNFLKESKRVLQPSATMLIATNTPEFYSHRWVTCDINFPENNPPHRSGQIVKAMLLPEKVQVNDYFWSDLDYRSAFNQAGFLVRDAHYPIAPSNEKGWLDETKVAPYVIYELGKT